MKETPLCFGDIRINNMSRLIVFSDQFSNKKLNSISVGKVENSNMPIVLVVVTESKRDKMEKLEKLLARKPLVVLVSIGEYTREDLDQEYLLNIKNGRIPTELRGAYAWLCSLTGNEEFIKVVIHTKSDF